MLLIQLAENLRGDDRHGPEPCSLIETRLIFQSSFEALESLYGGFLAFAEVLILRHCFIGLSAERLLAAMGIDEFHQIAGTVFGSPRHRTGELGAHFERV